MSGGHNWQERSLPPDIRLPESAGACRARLAELQGEIASIRVQIATTDIRRQAEKKPLDAAWFHRAKTALRLKQQESAFVSAHLASFSDTRCNYRRERFKDALIEVLRSNCDDERWAAHLARARELEQTQEAHHG